MAKRVYFAFHYQDVIEFRANVVRKHNFVGGVEGAGYYDHSIWEEAKKESPLALKRLINSELNNTSVTAVLIGSQTWARRWVRYEIMKSIERGNRILGIHINGIKSKNGSVKDPGRNPFDFIGLEISADGIRAKPTELSGGSWVYYKDLGAFDILPQPFGNCGKNLALSHWIPVYDWVADDGYSNFSLWIS